MSTYAYKCLECGNAFDVEATIQEKEEGKGKKFTCSKCQSENVKQEFSAGNFIKNIFKGGKESEGCCSEGESCSTGHESNEKKGDCCGGHKKDDGHGDENKGCGCC